MVLYIFVLGSLMQAAILAAEQVDNNLVAFLPVQGAVDHKDCPKFQTALVNILYI